MKRGIDVSALQGKLDWSRIETDFAMLKATQGRGETKATEGLRVFTDRRFRENIVGASDNGIAVGCYHYFTARTRAEAIYEAEYFCRVLEPYRSRIGLWAAVDVESQRWLDGLDKRMLGEAVEAFIDRVGKAGFAPMLYTNPDFLTYRLEKASDVDIWLAHWNVTSPMKVERMKLWQYGIGEVEGIGKCDLNYGYFDESKYSVGDSYVIRRGARYSNGKAVPERLIGQSFTIGRVLEGRILLKEINSWVNI